MSEEAGFLEALKANPADDTARLVYADWLDEHDEPARAEYLRLVTALARAEQDYAREQPEVSRVIALAEQLPPEWRAEAGSRFKVVFYDCNDRAKIVPVIKAVRASAGVGLAEAKGMVEWPPSELLECVRFEHGLIAREIIRTAGGTIYIHPFERTDRPIGIYFDIVATRQSLSTMRDESDSLECLAAFAAFLRVAMNIGEVEARRLAQNERVVLAQHQEPVSAKRRFRELFKHIRWVPHDDSAEEEPAWGIWPHLIPTGRLIANTP